MVAAQEGGRGQCRLGTWFLRNLDLVRCRVFKSLSYLLFMEIFCEVIVLKAYELNWTLTK